MFKCQHCGEILSIAGSGVVIACNCSGSIQENLIHKARSKALTAEREAQRLKDKERKIRK
jgi:hypothetical protein